MEIDRIPRRERRHYRKYKDGDIVYTDLPSEEKTSYRKIESYPKDDIKVKSLLDIDKKKEKVDDGKIKKVLNNLSEIISPDIDVVAETIYDQIKNDDFYNFEKKEIKETIKSSRHYRATRDSKNNKEIVDSENMKSLVEDVFMQMDNEEEVKDVKKKSDTVKEDVKKKKETSKKSVMKEKSSEKKKSDIQDLLDEDDDSLDLEDSDEDDLGLKF